MVSPRPVPGAAGDQRIKNMVFQFCGNAWAVVDDLQQHGQLVSACAPASPGGHPVQHDLAASVHGLDGVAHDIEHHLNQLSLSAVSAGRLVS